MVSDDERREVARELKDFEFYYPENLDKILREILHIDDEAWVPRLLADLIEPSCDREELLALADEMVICAGAYPKKSSTSPLLLRFARRIREACGEASA